jgi:hypothetical protein
MEIAQKPSDCLSLSQLLIDPQVPTLTDIQALIKRCQQERLMHLELQKSLS